jgi:hypothetical protein
MVGAPCPGGNRRTGRQILATNELLAPLHLKIYRTMEMELRAESIVLDQAENLSLWVSNLERSSNRKEIEVVRVKRRSGKCDCT